VKGVLRVAPGLVALALALWARPAEAQTTMVRVNGVARPVYFNDGDTFKVLAGPMRLRNARLAGFNTLESYGPAHRWGDWTTHEMYVVAKLATLNARRGKWSCTADPTQRDGYGRSLAICPDLALDHISKGLAHALSIDGPSPRSFLRAQRRAIVQKRGMWAHGVPPMVLTSLHSVDERLDNADNYNRLVSALDGQSVKWKHQDKYAECEEVCFKAPVAGREALLQVIAALRADEETKDVVYGYEDPYLLALLGEFVATGRVPQVFPKNGHKAVKVELDALMQAGAFGTLQDKKVACMVYVPFERRYGAIKAECLH
jgi:endonuclease YncB( thermonuclease family)